MENSEQIKEWAKGYAKKLYEMDGVTPVNRPKTTQAVIDGFSKLLDAQDDKGIKKYSTTIDEAVLDENGEPYDWRLMAMEELADFSKYQVKEIRRLEGLVNEVTDFADKKIEELDNARQGCEKYRKDNKQLKEELEKRNYAIIENCDLRVEIEDLKITNEKLTNRANSWERIANGNYKAVVKVEKERDEFKKQFIKAHAEIQDLQYKLKVAEKERDEFKRAWSCSSEAKTHDCHKNQAIHWQGKDIVKVKCQICDKTLYQA
jgi:predicted  nucleic acid-binding Zn-ribbon protein